MIGGRLARGAAWAPDPEQAVALAALPQPPRHLGREGAGQYRLLIASLAKRRAIERADVPLIEMAASAYQEWFRLDREIHEGDALLQAGERGAFMSGRAQARAAAANAYRRAIAELGVGSVAARMKVFETVQTDFLAHLDMPAPTGAAGDPYEPRTRH